MMRQSRSSNVMVNLEPSIHAIMLELIEKEGLSASGYARKLIIDDLRKRGLLPDSLLADLYSNTTRF